MQCKGVKKMGQLSAKVSYFSSIMDDHSIDQQGYVSVASQFRYPETAICDDISLC